MMCVRESKGSRKDVIFCGPTTKALPNPPPPSSLVVTFISDFFRASKKVLFFPEFTPTPPLSGPKKGLFCGFPKWEREEKDVCYFTILLFNRKTLL